MYAVTYTAYSIQKFQGTVCRLQESFPYSKMSSALRYEVLSQRTESTLTQQMPESASADLSVSISHFNLPNYVNAAL